MTLSNMIPSFQERLPAHRRKPLAL